MRKKTEVLALARPAPSHLWLKCALSAAVVAMAGLLASNSDAATRAPQLDVQDELAARYTLALQRRSVEAAAIARFELSDQDYSAFSGVGVIACTAGAQTRSSTAFLVGAFDLAVTVAHTFQSAPGEPEVECLYNSMDSLGQVRERIPVAYVKTEWNAATASESHKDLAVVRLSKASRYAQRTMPLGRFSGAPTPAVLVGYKADVDVDTLKRKARGTVYGRRSNAQGFVHDIASRDLAAGSPVLDERTGVIIGVHSPNGPRRNTMIAMSEWLETTLRAEMQVVQTGANTP